MSGATWKRIHAIAVCLFILLWIVAVPTGWIKSVTFVAHMSMLALVYSGLAAYQGSRTEEKQDKS